MEGTELASPNDSGALVHRKSGLRAAGQFLFHGPTFMTRMGGHSPRLGPREDENKMKRVTMANMQKLQLKYSAGAVRQNSTTS